MEKQHNRGQDGAGIATLKLNVEPGYQYMHRLRVSGSGAIKEIFNQVNNEVSELEKMYPDLKKHPGLLKGYLRFMGEAMMGHLRYGTQGRNNVAFCHPFVKPDINPARNLTMAGNFNLVNTDELYNALEGNPTEEERSSDLGAMIQTVHHYLCKEEALSPENPDLVKVLQQATSKFDGGFVCGGLVGNGSSFVMRDKNGIRPAYYYQDDEVIVVASERPAIQTTFDLQIEDIKELEPGHAIIVDAEGKFHNERILEAAPKTACSFERIYFSRGSDADIYKERIALGENLSDDVLKAIDYDLKNTIVSFIPNTAEIAFYGLIKGLETFLKNIEADRIIKNKHKMTDEEIRELIHRRVRIEKIAIKDVKLRTFITEDSSRDEMVQHVYDITYGTVKKGLDTLVVIDDSIVRGTTLKQSILTMLDRLKPKRIIVVSSAPQIRYPDCYGIDMSKMGDFIAFQAAVALLKDHGKEHLMTEAYELCKNASDEQLMQENYVKRIYNDFTPQEISDKIAALLKPEHVTAEVNIIYQSIEGLHKSCPNNTGDWYFTGNYPTKGGNRVANKAFMNYMERKEGRGY
ncbi:amidophosphoribosyltransferase [Taibaiella sp. KBW10]|uniref:amidophosphoribosyltransferase n=1 Tax=Taibaiella sp. KBW10 TaxID=2153357 RepID=UPI001F3DE3EE|nr:amidophosphoribosyltransferase [Taibaiella sp. KBW10]